MDNLDRELEHLMLSMLQTDPDKYREMCALMGIDDPDDFAEFLKTDTKQQDH